MAAHSSLEFKYIYGTSYLVTGLLGVLINAIEIYWILRKREQKRAFDKIVLSLSLADTVSGIFFFLIGLGIILFTCNLADFRLVQYAVMGLNFSVMASLNHVLLIALQRAFAAIFLKMSKTMQKGWCLHFVIVLVWVSAGIYGVLSLHVIKDFIRLNSYVIILYSTASMLLFGPVLCKANQECLTLQDDAACLCGRRVIVHSIMVTTSLFICYFPFAINNLLMQNNVTMGAFFDILVAINPTFDSMVYFYVNRRKDGKMRLQDANSNLQIADDNDSERIEV